MMLRLIVMMTSVDDRKLCLKLHISESSVSDSLLFSIFFCYFCFPNQGQEQRGAPNERVKGVGRLEMKLK